MTIRIAHVSDVHFGGELARAAEAAVEAVAQFDPIVVVVTGDLTLNGRPNEFRSARDWLSRLSHPTVVTPGNHDTPYWNLPLRALRPFGRYEQYIGPHELMAFDAPQLSIRSLNSARGAQPRLDWSKGAIALDKLKQIDWGGGVRVFACHHPLIDLEGSPVTGGVHGGALAAELLAAAGVELVLTGHVHVPFAVPLTTAGPACYAVGAGTLSGRLRGAPASFTTIVMTELAFEVTVQAWTGEQFEAGDARRLVRAALPRRR